MLSSIYLFTLWFFVLLMSFATQNTVIWILPSISFTVSLWVVPGYEFPFTQCTRIQIFSSMTVHVTIYVAPRDGSFATQRTLIWNLPSINLHVALCVVCDCMVFAIYRPNFILMARNNMSLHYIFHVALPVTIFTIFLVIQFFLNTDCNDLTAEINMVLSLSSEDHTRTLLDPHMLCQPLFRRVCAVALITIKLF